MKSSRIDEGDYEYRTYRIVTQEHPKLLKYACYDPHENFVGVSSTIHGCEDLIDQHIHNQNPD